MDVYLRYHGTGCQHRHAGELFTRVGFIVTNVRLPSRAVVRFYNKRGTAEQWIKVGKQAATVGESAKNGGEERAHVSRGVREMQSNRGVSLRFRAGGVYRFWVPGAGRSAANKLAATDARWYSIGSFRTAKMEIPVKTKYADWTGLDAGVPRDVQRVYKEHL